MPAIVARSVIASRNSDPAQWKSDKYSPGRMQRSITSFEGRSAIPCMRCLGTPARRMSYRRQLAINDRLTLKSLTWNICFILITKRSLLIASLELTPGQNRTRGLRLPVDKLYDIECKYRVRQKTGPHLYKLMTPCSVLYPDSFGMSPNLNIVCTSSHALH